MDGLAFAIGSNAVLIVAAGVLGMLVGYFGLRRLRKDPPAAVPVPPEMVSAPASPVEESEMAGAAGTGVFTDTAGPDPVTRPGSPTPAAVPTRTGASPIEPATVNELTDTVVRPAIPAESASPEPPMPSVDAATQAQLEDLREVLRWREIEFSRLEAGAVTAWDRTMPALQGRIAELETELAELKAANAGLTEALGLAQERAQRLQESRRK